MLKTLFFEVVYLVKFHAALKDGNVTKASLHFAKYKENSDKSEQAVNARLQDARVMLNRQTETVNQMKAALQ